MGNDVELGEIPILITKEPKDKESDIKKFRDRKTEKKIKQVHKGLSGR